jgi:ATP-citrate lyase beta-subunit
MAQRAIREFHAKKMLLRYWPDYFGKKMKYEGNLLLVTPETHLEELGREHHWLYEKRLAVKPDELFGKRGKHGLILLNATLDDAIAWIKEKMDHEVEIGGIKDRLTHFLIEEYVPHGEEMYIAIESERDGERILFSSQGGMEIEDMWYSVGAVAVPILEDLDIQHLHPNLPEKLSDRKNRLLVEFAGGLFNFYRETGFTYLEVNPFVFSAENIVPLDVVARLDDTAQFQCGHLWGDIEFPAPFGRRSTAEEAYVAALDHKSGASMKLTVLNPNGRIWTMVAGGGASVIYADTIVDHGFGHELANYGEYSGNPSTDETYEYSKTILDVMCRYRDPRGKILIIGGGIANFTDVNNTFTGIIKAIRQYRRQLVDNNVSIYVRRGGPNYQLGLENMKKLGEYLGIPIHVYGPELHMTRIVKIALKADRGE